MPIDRFNVIRVAMRWMMAIFYVAAGIAHLYAPDKLLAITPSWVPFAPQVIFVTGLCELAGALALVTTPLRRWAGFALVSRFRSSSHFAEPRFELRNRKDTSKLLI